MCYSRNLPFLESLVWYLRYLVELLSVIRGKMLQLIDTKISHSSFKLWSCRPMSRTSRCHRARRSETSQLRFQWPSSSALISLHLKCKSLVRAGFQHPTRRELTQWWQLKREVDSASKSCWGVSEHANLSFGVELSSPCTHHERIVNAIKTVDKGDKVN